MSLTIRIEGNCQTRSGIYWYLTVSDPAREWENIPWGWESGDFKTAIETEAALQAMTDVIGRNITNRLKNGPGISKEHPIDIPVDRPELIPEARRGSRFQRTESVKQACRAVTNPDDLDLPKLRIVVFELARLLGLLESVG